MFRAMNFKCDSAVPNLCVFNTDQSGCSSVPRACSSRLHWTLMLVIWASSGVLLPAQVLNIWSNPGSAAWEDAHNWSLGIRPAPNQTIAINNGGFKAVSISSSTVAGFPDSMTVSNLSISAPPDALSVLLLNYAGTGVPLHVGDVF